MRVVSYCRVSTDEQAEEGVSLAAQAAKNEAFARLYDLQVVASIEDAGESAKSLDRPGIQRALEMLRRGEADGILVTKLDRLTREVGDWSMLLSRYFSEKAGKKLFSVTEHVDTSSAIGRMVLNILMSINQGERELIGERTRDALRHKMSRRQRVGKVLFGFSLADDGVTLVENAAEMKAIALMVELRRDGMTLRGIAAELQAMGVRTREGRAWSHRVVADILKRATASAAA